MEDDDDSLELLRAVGEAGQVTLDLLRGRQAGPFDRAIDVAVSRLRRKLEDDGRNAQLIKTVRGGGYVLAATVERA